MRSIIVSDTSQGTTWAPVIIYEDKVYMSPIGTDNTVTYTETTPLGNANNFLEYNYNEGSSMKSVIGNASTNAMEKEDTSTPNNPSIQSEKKPRKSVNSKEISSAINEVFETKEARSIAGKIDKKEATKKDFVTYVTDKVVSKLGVERIRPTVIRKVEDIVKSFCK